MSATSADGSVGFVGWWRGIARQLQRPLASYYTLLAASAMLLTVGLVMVLSASSVASFRESGNSYAIFARQLMWAGIGVPCAWIASVTPPKLVRLLVWPGLAVALVLLTLTQTSLGFAVNGNRNWLRLGPLTIQPSELAKLAVVLWSAHVLANKQKLLKNPMHVLIPLAPVLGLVTGLVILGRDLGTALVLFAILLGLLFVAGLPKRWFAVAVSVVSVTAFGFAATSQHRKDRLTSFLDPFADFQGPGWQAGHGLIGLSSGGLFGRGMGASQQKWGSLPYAHTDFIFAVVGEELGLLGTLMVLGLFAALVFALLKLAMTTRDPFVRYTAAGVTIWISAQMVINIGMVLAVLPVVGIPLPLLSYGGSALIPSLVALGFLIGCARREPQGRSARSRSPRRQPTSLGVVGRSRRVRS